jgi:ArsR family transcriptional regulator
MRIRKNLADNTTLTDDEVFAAAKVADALAHPARIRMLQFILAENIARRKVTNKDVVAAFEYSQATVSQHLSKLVIGGVLETRKQGTSTCYYAHPGTLVSYSKTVLKISS